MRPGSPFRLLTPLACLLLATAGSAHAINLTYDVVGVELTATVEAELDFVIHHNLGTSNGSLSANGALSSTPDGTLVADWGAPGWTGSLDFAAADISAPDPGSIDGDGELTIDLPIVGDVDIPVGFSFDFDPLNIQLAAPTSGALFPVSPAGPGPWFTVPVADLDVLVQGDLDFDVFGIGASFDDLVLLDDTVSGIPLPVQLARLFDGPTEVGTQITIGPLEDLAFDLSGFSDSFDVPGCEVDNPVTSGCILDVSSVDVTANTLNLSNISLSIVAENREHLVPEPAPLSLFGAAALVLGLVRRSRR